MKSPNLIEVHQTFDRNKELDEAIFLAICGLNLCREKSCITGVTRLEIAKAKLEKIISKINNKLEQENNIVFTTDEIE